MELKDSGNRTSYDSGAMREIGGKGRCDLMPLGIIAEYLSDDILRYIDEYIYTGNVRKLYAALDDFSQYYKSNIYTMLLDSAIQYEEGAKKYKERNWEKGLPLHCYIDSAVRHYFKFKRGDKDEPHDRAFVWNILGAVWTNRNKPELIDLPFVSSDSVTVTQVDYRELSQEQKAMYTLAANGTIQK